MNAPATSIDLYSSSLARLRAMPSTDLWAEVDSLDPIWVDLKVVPGV